MALPSRTVQGEKRPRRVLLISDGHGEDWVAAQIALQIRRLCAQQDEKSVELLALPMVGNGHSYRRIDVPVAMSTRVLPSGGFTFKTMRGLWLDLRAGLTEYGAALVRSVRELADWSDLVLAVGDILPLGLAWLTRKPYIFVGCTKSDYYNEGVRSCYFPWERALLAPPRCLHTFTRDRITCHNLQLLGVTASFWGNPMMDGLEPGESVLSRCEGTMIGLLPGSRPGETQRNLADMLPCLEAVQAHFSAPVHFEAAISAGLGFESFERVLRALDWQPVGTGRFERAGTSMVLSTDKFASLLHASDALIAMAGTATEQAVGLGKPVITIPGSGPQFTRRFAYLQRQLLGESIAIVDVPPAQRPEAVASTLQALLGDRTRLERIVRNGRERMGTAGGAHQIARFVLDQFPVATPDGTPRPRG